MPPKTKEKGKKFSKKNQNPYQYSKKTALGEWAKTPEGRMAHTEVGMMGLVAKPRYPEGPEEPGHELWRTKHPLRAGNWAATKEARPKDCVIHESEMISQWTEAEAESFMCGFLCKVRAFDSIFCGAVSEGRGTGCCASIRS